MLGKCTLLSTLVPITIIFLLISILDSNITSIVYNYSGLLVLSYLATLSYILYFGEEDEL